MEAATLESVKKVLGLQVRSPGAPGPLTLKEVEELEQLTQQLMQDMEHPQRQNVAVNELCGRCHQPLARAQPAVRALGQLFHIACFTCHQCAQQLQGQQFYSLEGAPYCEGCYTVSWAVLGSQALEAGCGVLVPCQPPPAASSGHPGEVQHLRGAHH